MMNWKGFNDRCRTARKEKDMNQKELAEKIHVTVQTISAYETGTKTPTIDNAVDLANALDVSLLWLLGLPETQRPQRYTNYADIVEALTAFEECAYSCLVMEQVEDLDGWREVSITREGSTYYLDNLGKDGQKTKDLLEYYKRNPYRETENGTAPNPSVNSVRRPILRIDDVTIASFYIGREQMLGLLAAGVIDQRLYDSWYEGQLAVLRSKPLARTVSGERGDHGK